MIGLKNLAGPPRPYAVRKGSSSFMKQYLVKVPVKNEEKSMRNDYESPFEEVRSVADTLLLSVCLATFGISFCVGIGAITIRAILSHFWG